MMLGLLSVFVLLFLVLPLAASVAVLWWTRNRILATLVAPLIFLMLVATDVAKGWFIPVADRALSGGAGLDYFLARNFETVSLVVLLLLASGLFAFLPRRLLGLVPTARSSPRPGAAT